MSGARVHGRIVSVVQRIVLRTAPTPLGRALWPLVYEAVARAGLAYLVRGERGATIYTRSSFGTSDFLPGLSDVDTVIVLAPAPGAGRPTAARGRVTARWSRLYALPMVPRLLDWPYMYDDADLTDLAGGTALTYGLDRSDVHAHDRGGYFAREANVDWVRRLERPELGSSTARWRRRRGPERRPAEPPTDAQRARVEAWLELVYWWRWAFGVCVTPAGPRAADICVKLITEPARIWLRVAHGEHASGRSDALWRAARRLPEEQDALQMALDLAGRLPRSPEPPVAEVMPALVRFSARVAELIAAEVAGSGVTQVRLDGLAASGAPAGAALPLCDWRALACPAAAEEVFVPRAGDPGDPVALAAATRAHRPGAYQALRAGGLIVFPAPSHFGTRLRALKSAISDPVTFALASGERVADFPAVSGYSALDTARRAVAEHRAWLRTGRSVPNVVDEPMGPGETLGMLLTAARAALFLESIAAGAPRLPLTVAETARRLGERAPESALLADEAIGELHEFSAARRLPAVATIEALRRLVLTLPGYASAPAG